MRDNWRYLIVVALLAVLAVVFSVFGTVAPPLAGEIVAPQQGLPSDSSSIAHFAYPPSFDSGWMEITRCGQYYDVVHNLNTTDVFVDITGKQTLAGGEHKRNFGVTNYLGWRYSYANQFGTDEVESIEMMSDGGYVWAGYAPDASLHIANFRLVVTYPDGDKRLDKMIGGSGDDKAYSFERTSDGGYALAGYTSSYGAGSLDFLLAKIDSSGTLQWNKTYGGVGVDRAYSVIQTADGGYAVAGSSSSYTTSYEFWLVKTDSLGTVQWSATYGGANDEEAYSVIQTIDGGYIIGGYTYSFGVGNSDLWLVKTDSSGVTQWNKTYGGIGNDEVYSMIQTSDGGYALAGHTTSFGVPAMSFWLVKTDSSGTVQWSKTYGSGEARSVIEAVEGGYVLAGNGFASLVKTDSNGNEQWAKFLKGDTSRCVVEASVGRYVVGGNSGGDSMLVTPDIESGLTWTDSTSDTITLYRGATDAYWNYVRVRVWTIKEPTWQYGDINQDGIVDAKDLYIVSRNYGKTLSLLSLSGIIGIAGVQTIKKRKQPS